MYGPITTEPSRAKANVFYTLVDPVSPPPNPAFGRGFWWRRRVLPPGPKGLLRRAFIAIAGLRRHPEYMQLRAAKKGPPRRRVNSSASTAKFRLWQAPARSAHARFWRFWRFWRRPRFRPPKPQRRFC